MARRYIPSSLLQTFFALIFGIDMFGSYALIGHCRPSDVTPVTVSSKSFAISMHNVCITNEKTKAHSPANIMWSELGKKKLLFVVCLHHSRRTTFWFTFRQ